MRTRSSNASSRWWPTFSGRCCPRSCPQSRARAGGVLSHVAVGRRRLLRLLSVAGGQWGILIADVSGHGTPAAVMMAITHSLAHSLPGPADPRPCSWDTSTGSLSQHYTVANEVFVTAFYGIFDPIARTLTYSSAGHNPPRLKRCGDGSVSSLEEVGGPPLGLDRRARVRRDDAGTSARRHPGVLHRWHHRGHGMRRNAQFGTGRSGCRF